MKRHSLAASPLGMHVCRSMISNSSDPNPISSWSARIEVTCMGRRFSPQVVWY